MRKIFKFSLPSITCSNCIDTVETQLKTQRGPDQKIEIKKFATNLVRKTLVIEIESEGLDDKAISEIIKEKLDEVGFAAVIIGAKEVSAVPHMFKGIVGIASGAAFLLLSMLGGGMPIVASAILTGVSTLLSLYVGKEIFIEAYKKVTVLKILEMNALFSASALIAITASIVSLFVPWVPCMLEAALLTFGFRHLGIAIENRAKEHVVDGVNFIERTPPYTLVQVSKDNFAERLTSEIKPGDIIRVAAGKIIPLDGVCLNNDARLDVSIIKGDFASKSVAAGFAVAAGMKVAGLQSVDIKVTAIQENSFLARLDAAIETAETEKAPLEATSQTILKYFIPALFILSIATSGLAGMLFGSAMAIKCAVSLLVSACPCTLGSIVPLAVTVALGKASKEGILFRSGMALQAAAKTDTVIFDLNGTLTEGNYVVSAIEEDPNLEYLYELEKDAEHPIGAAVANYLNAKNYPKSTVALTTEPLPGVCNGGKKLRINGINYYVGNRTLMNELGLNGVSTANIKSEQTIYFASENPVSGEKKLLKQITVKDPLKKDALAVINELRKNGKDIHICTGADRETALSYAAELGIPEDKVFADCIPLTDSTNAQQHTKSTYINQLQDKNKTVAMVGDALNDASPLRTSDLGVLVKSQASADIMEANADVVIESATLTPLLAGFEIGNSMVQNINQNLKLSFIYNFVTLGLISCFACCAGIVFSPGIGVMLMIAQASMVMLNVQRFKQQEVAYAQPNKAGESTNSKIYQQLGFSPEQTNAQQVKPTESNVVTLRAEPQQTVSNTPPADVSIKAYRK